MGDSSEKNNSRGIGGASESGVEQVDALLSSPEFIESLQSDHFRAFLDHLPVGIVVARQVRGEERIIYSNSAFETLTGIDASTSKGRTWSIVDNYVLDGASDIRLGHAIISGDEFLGTFRLANETSAQAVLETYVTTIESTEDGSRFRLAVLVDVTERDPSDRDRIDRELRERDMQLRELQHRVRNTLQIVTALVRLEARNAHEGRTPDFETVASRIQALSILYEALSASAADQVIDLGEYLSAIASAGMRGFAKEGILLDMKVECCPVAIHVAMSTGLVVNEVMTNAFKHAFPTHESGTITLRCLREGNACAVSIADDGQGLPPGTTWPPAGKIAALIVQSLEENAKTRVAVESDADKGMRVSFVVPTLHADNMCS